MFSSIKFLLIALIWNYFNRPKIIQVNYITFDMMDIFVKCFENFNSIFIGTLVAIQKQPKDSSAHNNFV